MGDEGFDYVGGEDKQLGPEEEILDAGQLERVEEELPPEPSFLVDPTGYGKGMRPRVTLPDGTPLGVWLSRPERCDLSGSELYVLLTEMGLDEKHAAWFGGMRDQALEATKEIMSQPAMQGLLRREAEAEERTSRVRAAFLKAQQKK